MCTPGKRLAASARVLFSALQSPVASGSRTGLQISAGIPQNPPHPTRVASCSVFQPRWPAATLPSHRQFFSIPQGASKKYNERRLVGYSPEQLYEVVANVREYQEFVPWCQKSQVLKRVGEEYFEAELEVGFQVFVERYTSKVTLKRPKLVKSTVANSTLFGNLDSTWSMQQGPAPNTCWLNFHVEFSFRSTLYRHVADVFFAEVVQQMMGAFEKRCALKYGSSSLISCKVVTNKQTIGPEKKALQEPGARAPLKNS